MEYHYSSSSAHANVTTLKLPISAYFDVQAFYVSSATFKPSSSRTKVYLDRTPRDCNFVGKGPQYRWKVQSPTRLFQTRTLFIHIYPPTVNDLRISKRTPSHIFSVTFGDVMSCTTPSFVGISESTSWTYIQRRTLASSHDVELGIEVSPLKCYNLSDLIIQYVGPPSTLDDLVLQQTEVSNVISSMRGSLEDLGPRILDVLNVGDAFMSIVKDIHPIVALVVVALSIPMKILRNKVNYGANACELSEQMQYLARDLKALEGIEEADDLLLDSLVTLLACLIDACESLKSYVDAGSIKRTSRALYDDGFVNLTHKLTAYKAQLQDRLVIYLATRRRRDDELQTLRNFLQPVTSPPPCVSCHPGTRKSQLQKIREWLGDTEPQSKTMWITGSPGAGKSTIASSICSQYSGQSSDLFTFFFQASSKDGLQSPSSVWPALAWDLAQAHPSIRSSLSAVARSQRAVPSDILAQFDGLIVKPLLDNVSLFSEKPCTFLIDALDEGMHEDHQAWSVFLDTLSRFHQSLSSVNCRLIVLSRELGDIEDYIAASSCRLHLFVGASYMHEGTEEWQDVHTFLSAHLGSESCCPKPLEEDTLRALSSTACGLFIWASTAIKYIRKGKHIYASRLPHLLRRSNNNSTSDDPLDVLNDLYAQVLKTAFSNLRLESERTALRLFLSITLLSNGSVYSVEDFTTLSDSLKILDLPLIGDLLPLLTVLPEDKPPIEVGAQKYQFSHQTIHEFIANCSRRGEFGISVADGTSVLSDRMKNLLADTTQVRVSKIDCCQGHLKDLNQCLRSFESVSESATLDHARIIDSVCNASSDLDAIRLSLGFAAHTRVWLGIPGLNFPGIMAIIDPGRTWKLSFLPPEHLQRQLQEVTQTFRTWVQDVKRQPDLTQDRGVVQDLRQAVKEANNLLEQLEKCNNVGAGQDEAMAMTADEVDVLLQQSKDNVKRVFASASEIRGRNARLDNAMTQTEGLLTQLVDKIERCPEGVSLNALDRDEESDGEFFTRFMTVMGEFVQTMDEQRDATTPRNTSGLDTDAIMGLFELVKDIPLPEIDRGESDGVGPNFGAFMDSVVSMSIHQSSAAQSTIAVLAPEQGVSDINQVARGIRGETSDEEAVSPFLELD